MSISFNNGTLAKCLFVIVRIEVDNQGTLILLGFINFHFKWNHFLLISQQRYVREALRYLKNKKLLPFLRKKTYIVSIKQRRRMSF